MNSLVRSPQGDHVGSGTLIQFGPGVQVTATSISFDESVGFNEMEQIGELIVGSVNQSAWMIGGWLNHLRKFRHRYPEGVEKLERRYQTLKNHAYVDAHVPEANREEELTWSHHRAVASLTHDEQRLWLQDARRHNWTVAELEHEIRSTRPERTTAIAAVTPPLSISIDPARVTRWSSYADEHDMTVDELITKATDNYIQAGLA